MAGSAPVELELYPVADLRIMEIAKEIDGFDDATQGSQCFGQSIQRPAPCQPLQDHMRWCRARTE